MAKRFEECNSFDDVIEHILSGMVRKIEAEADPDMISATDKEVKKGMKKGEVVIYTIWALKKEEDFTWLNDHSAYPRNIGKGDRINYEEQLTKDATDIFENAKPGGAVVGIFLGMVDVVPLDTVFRNKAPFNNPLLAQYPFIALGAATLNREQRKLAWKEMDKIWGFDPEKFKTLNPEELRWKWHPWNLTKGEPAFCSVAGRVIFKNKGKYSPCPSPNRFDNKDALAWAQGVMKGNGDGADDATVTLEFSHDGKKEKRVYEKTGMIDGVNGRFLFEKLPAGITDIEAKATLAGYKATLEFPALPLAHSKDTDEALQNVILSLEETEKDTEILIRPTSKPRPHDKALIGPFGPQKSIALTVSPTRVERGVRAPFRIAKGRESQKTYHVFFINQRGAALTEAELLKDYGVDNIEITFSKGVSVKDKIGPYHDQFFETYPVRTNVAIDIKMDFATPFAAGSTLKNLYVYVSVQEGPLAPAMQTGMDQMMHAQMKAGSGHEDQLVGHGILDFNLYHIFLFNGGP